MSTSATKYRVEGPMGCTLGYVIAKSHREAWRKAERDERIQRHCLVIVFVSEVK